MMILLSSILFQNPGFFQQLGDRINEGGPLAMSLILFSFFIIIFLVVRAAINVTAAGHKFRKNISLINQLALIALVIGLFTQFIGLIQIFDAFESLDKVNPAMFAAGLKLTLLAPLFGGFTFLFGRISSFILNWVRKSDLDANTTKAY